MRFLPHITHAMILAFLRDTSCKALPLDSLAITIERGAERIVIEINEAGLPSRTPEAGVAVYAVSSFSQAQMTLEGLRWLPSLLD